MEYGVRSDQPPAPVAPYSVLCTPYSHRQRPIVSEHVSILQLEIDRIASRPHARGET